MQVLIGLFVASQLTCLIAGPVNNSTVRPSTLWNQTLPDNVNHYRTDLLEGDMLFDKVIRK